MRAHQARGGSLPQCDVSVVMMYRAWEECAGPPGERRFHSLNTLKAELAEVGDMFSRGRHHGGRWSSSDHSPHSPTVIPPSALDKPRIMKRYHRRRTR